MAISRFRRLAGVFAVTALLATGTAAIATGAYAADETHKVNVSNKRERLAVHGYDPVAYFTENKAVKGDAAITSEHNGAVYRFATAESKATFDADPAKYAPQYGGFCSYAVANGTTADIDPEAFTIVDGKLYLNYSKRIQARWEKDIPGYLAKSEANWPKIAAEK